MKIIKIYTGDNLNDLFEGNLHPIKQLEKVKIELDKQNDEYIIKTNSPYVTSAFENLGIKKDYKIIGYYNNVITYFDIIYDKFNKPLEKIIFE